MEIEDFFRDNKKLIIVFAFIYFIVLIFLIYNIWKPDSNEENPILKYEQISADDISNKIMANYIDQVSYRFILGEREQLNDIVSSDYTDYRNISKKELMDEFEKEGFFSMDTHIKDIKKYNLGEIFIYRGTLTNGIKEKYVNIIEEYPYDYSVSFDDLYKFKDNTIKREIEKVAFEISDIAYYMANIECSVKITNIDNNYAIFDLLSNRKVVLVLSDGQEYVAEFPKGIEHKQINLNPGSAISINMTFRVPLQEQEKIKHIEFRGVKIDGEESDLKVAI